ncbi:MAG: type II secretion system protein [Candidatus Saccharibacteria bacterium]|nr:type II secretion system protein [Candidatus Saccharibacteria bacterium]
MRCIKKIIKSLSAGKDKNQQGFTIVEVMIVLAIAGLILAVVFIAVPALQRNQRNSARQNDVAYIRSQMQQLYANNGGRLPSGNNAATDLAAIGTMAGVLKPDELNYVGTDRDNPPKLQTGKIGHVAGDTLTDSDHVYFMISDNFRTAPAAGTANTNTKLAEGSMIVVAGAKCKLDSFAVGPNTGAVGNFDDGTHLDDSSRGFAFFYRLEGQDTVFCQDDEN